MSIGGGGGGGDGDLDLPMDWIQSLTSAGLGGELLPPGAPLPPGVAALVASGSSGGNAAGAAAAAAAAGQPGVQPGGGSGGAVLSQAPSDMKEGDDLWAALFGPSSSMDLGPAAAAALAAGVTPSSAAPPAIAASVAPGQ